MAEREYYVKVDYEYGAENDDGTVEVKQKGSFYTFQLPYDHAVMLQSKAINPGWQMMLNGAMSLGEIKAGIAEGGPMKNPPK